MKRLKNLFFALALCAPLTAAAQDIEINAENFPDVNFRNWLLSQSYGADGWITTAEIKQITGINVGLKNISSLKGIEHFTALTSLICYYNQLTTLDVSKNTALTTLYCNSNQLTTLDVSKNTALTTLYCGNNQLTTLDVSKNTALTGLNCSGNQLTTLDVSKNTALTTLFCGYNQLTALDVSNNTALTTLYCDNNQLTALDVSNNTALTSLDYGYNQLTALDVSKHTALTYLDCSNSQLTALDVSKNTALTTLRCYSNQLTTLDVSKNTALTTLYCSSNQLTTLDVSKNTALTTLYCDDTQLTTLDVSKNTALTKLFCGYNQLTALDVSKNTALTTLYCYNNQIKGKAMDALISSLPETTAGELWAYDPYINDGNVITKSQVAAAKAKGWTSYGDDWVYEYEGIDDATTVSIGEDGLATYCPQYGIDLSNAENIAAYKAAINGNTVTLTKVEAVAAGEGVLLRSLSGSSVEEELPIALDAKANTDNAFVGTLTGIYLYETEGNATNFVLSKVDGVVGFFKANNTLLAAGKAYLPVENYDAARGITITFDGTTGISEVAPAQSTTDEAVYTLDGVRVANPTKGLYIKNGKKIFVK